MNRAFFIALSMLFLFSACAKQAENAAAKKEEEKGIDKEWKSGPLAFSVKTDRSEMTIADSLALSIVASVDKKYQVKLPELGDKLDEFSVKDFTKNAPALSDKNTMTYTQSYVLEPYLSGEYTIPAFTVQFWAEGENEADPHILESEPIKIKVDSLLPESLAELKMADAIGPLTPPPPDLGWLAVLVVGIVSGGCGIAALAYWYFVKRGAKTRIPTIPAHELAYRQLRKLVSENLIDKGETKLFYFRISDILRHYIENRFRLRAPEETTEEFLETMGSSDALGREQKRILGIFLGHCDLVKFARHAPSNGEIQKTFDSVKAFIHETESAEARIEDAPGAEPAVTVEGL
jgi:hypothetical protein